MNSSAATTPIADFCKALREARAYQRVTLEQIAASTCISLEYLAAIETGDWDGVPRAYLRGYLALYAQAVGMNREKVLRSFDELLSPSVASGGAILDHSNPLLSQPERVGVTRAKIRTSWFAALSQNRRASFGIMAIAVVLLWELLYVTRRVRIPAVEPRPFEEAVIEYRETVHGPLTLIEPDIGTTLEQGTASTPRWLQVIGTKAGQVRVLAEGAAAKRLLFRPYDTLQVVYRSGLQIEVVPANSAILFEDSLVQLAAIRTRGDTAFYRVDAKRAERLHDKPSGEEGLSDSKDGRRRPVD